MTAPTFDDGLPPFRQYAQELTQAQADAIKAEWLTHRDDPPQVLPAEPSVEVGPRVPRSLLVDLCRALGHDERLVVSIELLVDVVRVELIRSATELPLTRVVEHRVEP